MSEGESQLRRSKRNKFHLDVKSMMSGRLDAVVDRRLSPVPDAIKPTTAPRSSSRLSPASVDRTASASPVESKPPPEAVPEAETLTKVEEALPEPCFSMEQESDSLLGEAPPYLSPQKSPVPVEPAAEVAPMAGAELSPLGGLEAEANSSAENIDFDVGDVALGKRKRKAPVRHGDFDTGSNDEDSDSDQEDRMFGTAQIEYTNGGEVSPSEFFCTRCPAEFDSRVGLTNHMKLHGSRKQYSCDQCDFSCTNKKTMRHHKKLHKWHSSPKKPKHTDAQREEAGADQMPTTTNIKAPSPFSQAEIQPQMRAIDIALKLTPDEDAQPVETVENSTEVVEQMPVLFAEAQSVKPSPQPFEDFLNDNTLEKEDEEDDEAGTSGTQFHPRNTVQCPFCPFRTRSGERLRPHVAGHSRASGFLCSLCTFKHEAAGLLRRHILRIHGAKNFPWPPTYVTDGPQQVMTERPKRVRTPIPKRASAPPELRRARIKKPQPAVTVLKCTEGGCKYTTEHKNELMRHRLRHRSSKETVHKVRRLACQTCGLRVSNCGRLRVHRLLKHKAVHNRELYQSLLFEALGKRKPRLRKKSAKQQEERKVDKDLFKCTKCPYVCDQKLVLERHETKHMVKAENQCPNCTFSCRSVSFLEQHMRVHTASPSAPKKATPDRSSTPQLFSCHHCPYKSRHRCDMKAHLKMHEADNQYKCPHCTYSSQRQSALSMHEKLHENGDRSAKPTGMQQKESDQDDVEETQVAQVRARDGQILGRKVRRGDQVLYRCEACSTTAKLANEFYKHARHHFFEGPRQYNCDLCSFKTNDPTRISEHSRAHVPSGWEPCAEHLPFKCSECAFRSDTYGKQWHHLQKHKKQSRFRCHRCSYSVGAIMHLGDHVALHDYVDKHGGYELGSIDAQTQGGSGRNSADVEGRTPSALGLEKLTQLHLNIPPVPRLLLKHAAADDLTSEASSSARLKTCPHCPFECSDDMVFKLHCDMHNGRRPFKCNMCTYNCFSADALHSHLNLHAPPLSPVSAVNMRKRMAARRRNGSMQELEVLAPNATNVLQCTQCSFKTMKQDRFVEHRMEHVQLLQQRLMTTIKRSANDDALLKIKMRRKPGRSERMQLCSKCSFRCDTQVAYVRHLEFHGDPAATFHCKICDYGANTLSIVTFHELNHHLEGSLTDLQQHLALVNKETHKIDRFGPHAPQALRCQRCTFVCHEFEDLKNHCLEGHSGEDCDEQLKEMMKMALVPRSAVATIAL